MKRRLQHDPPSPESPADAGLRALAFVQQGTEQWDKLKAHLDAMSPEMRMELVCGLARRVHGIEAKVQLLVNQLDKSSPLAVIRDLHKDG